MERLQSPQTIAKIPQMINISKKYGKTEVPVFSSFEIDLDEEKSLAESYGVNIERYRDKRLEILGLTFRELHSLRSFSCVTIADLLECSVCVLRRIDNIGEKSLRHILKRVREYIKLDELETNVSNSDIDTVISGFSMLLRDKLVKPFVIAYGQSHDMSDNCILCSVSDEQSFSEFFESYTSGDNYADKEQVLGFLKWVNIDIVELKNKVTDEAFRELKESEKSVLLTLSATDRNGQHCNIGDVARVMHVTRQRIDQIFKKAIKKF